MCEAKITVCDHNDAYLTGRVVDAMAAGCLVLAYAQPVMDMLAPMGYVPIGLQADGRIDPKGLADTAVALIGSQSRRVAIVQRARRAVTGLSWEDQLLRVLGSIGVRLCI